MKFSNVIQSASNCSNSNLKIGHSLEELRDEDVYDLEGHELIKELKINLGIFTALSTMYTGELIKIKKYG